MKRRKGGEKGKRLEIRVKKRWHFIDFNPI
jgi:hypothetical protein